MIHRYSILPELLLFFFYTGLQAQEYSDRKVCSFPAVQNTSVEVSNKYGKIHIITWDVDSVRFEVDLHISVSNIEKLQKMRNNINFDFTATKYYIIGKTTFANSGNVITEFVDALIPSNLVTINYMVFVPKQTNLKIENKFGDVYIDDFGGNLEISLSNGDFKANALTGNSVIKISSGDGTINSIQSGKVFVSYGDLRIRQIGSLEMETKSSRVTIDKADHIKLDSHRDKYEVVDVNDFSVNGYFTDLQIDRLSKEMRCMLKYGNLTVNNIEAEFSFINVNSEYTDIDLLFDHGTSYNIDIAYHNDVIIVLPEGLAQVQSKDLNVEQKMKLTYGKIGDAANENSPKVTISATKKCTVNINQK